MILFFFFGLSIALFLLLLTLVKRNKANSDYTLAAWMAFMVIHLVFFLLDYTRTSDLYPHLLGIVLPLPILHGLFLYTYTLQTTSNRLPGGKYFFLHLIPFFLLVVLAIPFYLLSAGEKLQVYLNQGKGYEWYSAIQMALFVIVGFGYSIASVVQIRRHRRNLLHVFSNHEKKKLAWLESMSYALACICLLALMFDDQIIFSGVVIFILFIGVFGINQTPVFLTPLGEEGPSIPDHITAPHENPEKYQKSGLQDDDVLQRLDFIERFMAEHKPYKNPDLTLDDLATLVKIPSYQLSQVINSSAGKTFYHYVNSYRIKEFLSLASAPGSNRFTYLGLAYDCGFQSKTTFNKYFKIETGKTPSEYFQAAKAA